MEEIYKIMVQEEKSPNGDVEITSQPMLQSIPLSQYVPPQIHESLSSEMFASEVIIICVSAHRNPVV
ncbi:MAG: hypothetical protein ABIM36_03435 [candidate division WOR-3 bacterium]